MVRGGPLYLDGLGVIGFYLFSIRTEIITNEFLPWICFVSFMRISEFQILFCNSKEIKHVDSSVFPFWEEVLQRVVSGQLLGALFQNRGGPHVPELRGKRPNPENIKVGQKSIYLIRSKVGFRGWG